MNSSRRFIVSDTSILLSFVCANKQDILIKFSGSDPIHLPQVVVNEMERKLRDPRFKSGRSRWTRLINSRYFVVLEETDGLLARVRGFAGYNYTYQNGLAKNLGEFLGHPKRISMDGLHEHCRRPGADNVERFQIDRRGHLQRHALPIALLLHDVVTM